MITDLQYRLQPDSPTIKVLHLADIHYDPEYLAGANAMCGDPLCCRATSGEVVNATDAAGYWGDYRSCDMPWYLIEDAVSQMATRHPVINAIQQLSDKMQCQLKLLSLFRMLAILSGQEI